MKSSLAELLDEAVAMFQSLCKSHKPETTAFNTYIEMFPTQIVVLGAQVVWSSTVESSLMSGGDSLQTLHDVQVQLLDILAASVLKDLDLLTRRKCEHLITECVHQRDVIGSLIKAGASTSTHYLWLVQMRYVYKSEGDFISRLRVKMANADLEYGFEYIGVP